MHKWLSIGRAAAILEPGAGGYNQAVAKIFEALKSGAVGGKSGRRSPSHPDQRFSEIRDLSQDFFRDFRFRPQTLVNKLDWRSFAMEGGILVNRSEVEELDRARRHWFDETVGLSKAGATWRFVNALAWLATESMDAVRAVEIPAVNHTPLLKRNASRRGIGRLIKIAADDHCQCGSALTAAKEKWETCYCTEEAFGELRQALVSGRVTGFTLPDNKLLMPETANGIILRRQSFDLVFPEGIDDVTFSAEQIQSPSLSSAKLIESKGTIADGQTRPTEYEICLFICGVWGAGARKMHTAFERYHEKYGRQGGTRDDVFQPLWKVMTGNRIQGRQQVPPDAPVITGIIPKNI